MQKSHSGSFKRTSEKRDFTFKLGKVIIQNRTRAAIILKSILPWWRGQMQKSHSGSFKRTSEKRDFTFKLGKVIIQNRTRAAANYI